MHGFPHIPVTSPYMSSHPFQIPYAVPMGGYLPFHPPSRHAHPDFLPASERKLTSSSPPPDDTIFSLEEYRDFTGFTLQVMDKLDTLGFAPGDDLANVPQSTYEAAGFKYLEWQRIVKRNKTFHSHIKGRGHL